MRIAVIAAQGRSGQVFVKEALAAGHTVNAGIRGNSPFEPTEGLMTFECDATDSADVERLIDGCQAVVSLIGHVKGSATDVQTRAISTVISAMEQTKIKRLVSLTGTGVRRPGDAPSLLDTVANILVAIFDPNRVNDGKKHVREIEQSDLDWTIVRILKLANNEPGQFTLTEHGPAKSLTSRREVARAILEVLGSKRFIRAYPVISDFRKK